MHIIAENFFWMTYNVTLAIIPAFLGWLVYFSKSKIASFFLFLAWLSFVPNTLYLFTDILHLIKDINRGSIIFSLIILFQYAVLFIIGFFTFILALYPIEAFLKNFNIRAKYLNKNFSTYSIIIINLLIGYGMVLGRVYRLNSWDFLTRLDEVVLSAIDLATNIPFLFLAVLFGLFGNFLYFLFKDLVVKHALK